MSDTVKSRPQIQQEQQRLTDEMLEHVGDDSAWRIKQAEAFGEIRAVQRYQQLWMESHDRRDDQRFEELGKRVGTVSSGVNDYNNNKQQVLGAKKLLLGAVAVIAAIGGAILFAIDVYKAWKGAP